MIRQLHPFNHFAQLGDFYQIVNIHILESEPVHLRPECQVPSVRLQEVTVQVYAADQGLFMD